MPVSIGKKFVKVFMHLNCELYFTALGRWIEGPAAVMNNRIQVLESIVDFASDSNMDADQMLEVLFENPDVTLREDVQPIFAFNDKEDIEAFKRAQELVPAAVFQVGGEYFQHKMLKDAPKWPIGLRKDTVMVALKVLFRLPADAGPASLVMSTPGSGQREGYPLVVPSTFAQQLLQDLEKAKSKGNASASKAGKGAALEDNATGDTGDTDVGDDELGNGDDDDDADADADGRPAGDGSGRGSSDKKAGKRAAAAADGNDGDENDDDDAHAAKVSRTSSRGRPNTRGGSAAGRGAGRGRGQPRGGAKKEEEEEDESEEDEDDDEDDEDDEEDEEDGVKWSLDHPHVLARTKVAKAFPDGSSKGGKGKKAPAVKMFTGTVIQYAPPGPNDDDVALWKIEYEDGDFEDMDEVELNLAIAAYAKLQAEEEA